VFLSRLILAVLAVATAAGLGVDGAVAQSVEVSDIIRQIETSQALPRQAVKALNFKLNTGLGVVHLNDGILVPSSPVAGRSVEFVFVGDGRVVMDPGDEVERGQLEVFTGSPVFDESFGRAVFVIALDAASEKLSGLSPAGDDPRVQTAVELLDHWHSSPERRLLGVDARLLRDGVGDPLGRGFFCAAFEGEDLGRFLWIVDPLAEEQLTLGQFVQPRLTNRERRKAARDLEREQRRGKLIGREVGDLGIWDTWISASLRNAAGDPTPGTPGVESRHYAISAELEGKQLDMEAVARIQMDVLIEGLRVVTLDMDGDLNPVKVTDGGGVELEFTRSRDELTVLLARPAAAGDVLTVEVEYSGRPFNRLSSGAYSQRRPLGWYPHAGAIDRATYELDIRWPKKYQLFGSGAVVEEGIDDRRRWQRRALEVRALGFSFEVGDYEVAGGALGNISITVAIDRLGQDVSPDLAEDVLDRVRGPLAYFQSIYGPYPLDHLVLVSSPRGFSQGLLGFVTLSTAGIVDWDIWSELLGFEDPRLLIAHELAHQWWGNQVGWSSYRDQWISEAVANYSALLYERNRLRIMDEKRVGRGPTTGWRTALESQIEDGRPVESLGPVVMGARLNSSLSSKAYKAIVYQKGAVVLDMLARLYQEEAFLEILGRVVEVAGGHVITTDNFLALLQQLGGTDLQWFRRQYVNGTGIPDISYRYTIDEMADGRWVVEGEARQKPSLRATFGVVERSGGRLDVMRTTTARLDVTDSVLVVPFQIGVEGDPDSGPVGGGSDEGPRMVFTGRILLEGEVTPYRLEMDQRPEIFWLDRYGEVFGRFIAADRWPRRAALDKGMDLFVAGESQKAEEVLESAFDKPIFDADEKWLGFEVDTQRAARAVDASIHVLLGRMFLDDDRLEEAAEELEMAERTLEREDRWRFDRQLLPLEARLFLLSGEPGAAHRILRKELGGRHTLESAEAWALFAVASSLTDQSKDYLRACGRALELGVDLGPLRCP